MSRTTRTVNVVLLLSLLAGIVCPDGSVAAPVTPPRVLVLYSQRRELPINQQWERGIRAGIEANPGTQVAIDSEYLDFHRVEKSEDRQTLLGLVLSKYQAIKPDIVIPVHDGIAALFVRQNPFPEAAVVFCSILEQTRDQLPLSPKMTGVLYRFDARRTVQCARRLIPTTRTAIVISGSGEADRFLLEAVRADLAPEKEIQCEYWTGIPIDTLCDRVSQLPPGHVIIFNSFMRDRGGEIATVPRDVLKRIASASRVPVFALYDTMMGTGIVGGCMPPVDEQGRLAGEKVARILWGESPQDIPFSGTEMNRFLFDWTQLRRWGIREEDLPAGSVVLFRQPTVWEEYRAQVIAGVTVVVLQSLLIVGLLVNRRRRRRAEQQLADQLQFETVLSDVSSRFVGITSDAVSAEIERALACIVEQLRLDRGAVFLLSGDGRELRANITSVRAGETPPPDVVPLDSIPWMWSSLTHGDVFHVSSMSDLPAEAFHERELADRLGVKSVAAVALQDDEQVVGMLTFGLRTHEQAWDERILQRIRLVSEVIGNALAHIRADEALAASRNETQQLAGRILTAQEDERKRIARELHDDISQRLAAGAIEAGKAEQELTAPPTRAALAGLKEHLIALSDDVHRLSRQLHPAILDDLGLRDALRAECDRVAERGRLSVNFRCGPLPAGVPRDVALCVYRIAQEGLRNAVKHAQADRVDLTLNADLEFLDLEVRDFGCGFDPGTGRRSGGVGLASMEERVRLVGGELSISSRPGQGTCIQVRVPWPEDS
jgi:signal transduction histidine kinase